MFYCNNCRVKNNWPESIVGSYGKCEVCDTIDYCNDFPSTKLNIIEFDRRHEKGTSHYYLER